MVPQGWFADAPRETQPPPAAAPARRIAATRAPPARWMNAAPMPMRMRSPKRRSAIDMNSSTRPAQLQRSPTARRCHVEVCRCRAYARDEDFSNRSALRNDPRVRVLRAARDQADTLSRDGCQGNWCTKFVLIDCAAREANSSQARRGPVQGQFVCRRGPPSAEGCAFGSKVKVAPHLNHCARPVRVRHLGCGTRPAPYPCEGG